MNFEQHLQELAQWYCSLVKEPAWRDYVVQRMQDLSRSPLHAPVVQAVREAWREQANLRHGA